MKNSKIDKKQDILIEMLNDYDINYHSVINNNILETANHITKLVLHDIESIRGNNENK